VTTKCVKLADREWCYFAGVSCVPSQYLKHILFPRPTSAQDAVTSLNMISIITCR